MRSRRHRWRSTLVDLRCLLHYQLLRWLAQDAQTFAMDLALRKAVILVRGFSAFKRRKPQIESVKLGALMLDCSTGRVDLYLYRLDAARH